MTELNIENVYIHFDGESISLEVEPEVAQSHEDIVDLFDSAIYPQQVVRFTYLHDGIEEIRTLTPSGIVDALDGEQCVLGHDHDRDAPRQFRLDRVTLATIDEQIEPYRV